VTVLVGFLIAVFFISGWREYHGRQLSTRWLLVFTVAVAASFFSTRERHTVEKVRRQRLAVGWLAGLIITGIALVTLAFTTVTAPASGIALVVLLGCIVAASIRPINGLYAIVFLGLVGDAVVTPWFPFAKNFSSAESLLYLSNELSLSPLEILVATTVVFWLIDLKITPGRTLVRSPLFYAIGLFTCFVLIGFVHGIARGGDFRVAMFEGRAMFVLLPVYALITNLCDRRTLRLLAWTALSAIFLNVILALVYLRNLTTVDLEQMESLGEHSASTQWNLIILLTLVLFLYGAGTRPARVVLLAMCIPTAVVYLAAQRRSAVAGLVIALGFVMLSLWWRNRQRFIAVVPMLVVITIGYTGAFWNSTSPAGFPAQAIKSIVASSESSESDRSSDEYRVIENFDLNYTIQASPILGLGFGQRFYRPYPLPDISFFEFYEYIPHNSFMWIWIKTGFGGFVSMLAMFGLAVRSGVRSLVRSRDSTDAALGLIGITIVVMFAVFSFVDIAWSSQNMVFLALGFGLCAQAPREDTETAPEESMAEPGLEPEPARPAAQRFSV
jgi:hypothetical protein